MSKEEVLRAWGEPSHRDIAGEGIYENERWFYRLRAGETKVIYFERGLVRGWQTLSSLF